jgi:hypothetical protein
MANHKMKVVHDIRRADTPFPVGALPKAAADICREISDSFEVPLELPCTTALGLLAACCQKKAIVRMNATYTEQLNLFTLAISDTGDRKSNVFKLLRDAVIAAQNEYFAFNEDRIAESKIGFDMLKRKLAAAKREVVYGGEDCKYTLEDVKNFEKQLREYELLSVPKLLVDDATSEKLIDVLEEQGGSIATASPEGGLFSTLKTAVSANPTFDAYLKAYTGDSIEVARISRKGNAIESPKLSLIIACQPKTAMEMIQNKTFRDKGLPARFLFANCRSLVGMRTFDKPEVSAETIEAYNALIRKLLDGVFDRNTAQAELTLTPDGRAAYIEFSQGIESKLGDGGEYKFMQDWCAKLPGQMLRIAGILALCDGKDQIDVEIVSRAAAIAAWFTENSAVIFGEQGILAEDGFDIVLSRFIKECTIHKKGNYVKTADLFERYKEWAERQGYSEPTSQAFVGALRTMLTVRRDGDNGNVARGIALAD